MITGEDVICDMIEDALGTHFCEPLEISLKGSKNGEPTVILRNWLPIELITDNITRVNPRNIIAVFDANDTVAEYYISTMDKINDALITAARMKEMQEEKSLEEMTDVMEALLESQSKTIH